MRTIFGIGLDKYYQIRNYGSPEENEALDLHELKWAIAQEEKELTNSDRLLRSNNNDWVLDPQ